MNFKEHRTKWNNCQACSLCQTRKHVVLGRGSLPASILFVGEAPGASEDVLGQPFKGPAGQLLDQIIERALKGRKVALAFTNVVACLPVDENGKKSDEPEIEAIEACRDRLTEFVELAKPRAIVLVGKLSEKYTPLATERIEKEANIPAVQWRKIVHPSAILKLKTKQPEQIGLLIQTCTVTISDLLTDLGF